MKKHTLWMILGCGIPLLFIFLAPALGISGGSSLFIFIALMFGIHLLMPMHHGNHNHSKHDDNEELTPKNQEDSKEHHHH